MTIQTRQFIVEYDEARESYSFKSEQGLDDFMALKADVFAAIELLNAETSTFTPQFGSGSPESVITANYNRTYYDTSGLNAVQYINETVGASTGWQQVD
jgi:hypothetical protein